MNIDELLNSLTSGSRSPAEEGAQRIEEISGRMAVEAGGAAQAIGAIAQCIFAASMPALHAMFNEKSGEKASAQERFLFAIVLAGSVTTVTDDTEESMVCKVKVTPETISEAITVYTKLTGKDITPFLPEPMVRFAKSGQQTIN